MTQQPKLPKRRWDKEYDDLYQSPSGTYFLRYWSPKLRREIEPSLKTSVKAKAIKERKRILENLGEQKDKSAVGYKTLAPLIKRFKLEHPWESDSTRRTAYNQFDNHLLPYFGNYDPERVASLWKRYGDERREKDPGCSLSNARKYLGAVLNWAHSQNIIKKKPELENFDKGRKSPGKLVTDGQFDAVCEHLNQDWQDMAFMARFMGLRIGEIKNLEWQRVDLKTGVLTFEEKDTKTRKARYPVAPASVLEILKRRSVKGEDSPYVFYGKSPSVPFSTSDEHWQAAKRKAKVSFRFHDLRHTWLSLTFKKSNRYAEICTYAGLSLDEALKTYVKFSASDMKVVSEILPGKTGAASQND